MSLLLAVLTIMGVGHHDIDTQQLKCLSIAVYHEARGEPDKGKDAVAHVVLNRISHTWYADTICDVVYQGNGVHFTDIHKAKIKNPDLWVLSVYRATLAMQGQTKDPTKGAITYYNPKKVKKPNWDWKKLRFTGDIYNHRFYKEK